MFKKGVYAKVEREGCITNVLVATFRFRSRKYAAWFHEVTNAVCDYEHDHGKLLSGRYFVASPKDVEDAVKAPCFNLYIEHESLGQLVRGCELANYSSVYSDDVLSILSLASTVQYGSIINPRARIAEIAAIVCSDYESEVC